jgi:predicted ATPase
MSFPVLKIKNFGPIKDVEIELKPFTIFIGPNSAGKSTLCKVIASILNPYKHYNLILNHFSLDLINSKIQVNQKKLKRDDNNIEIVNDDLSKYFFNEYKISNYFNERTEIFFQSEKIQFNLKNSSTISYHSIRFINDIHNKHQILSILTAIQPTSIFENVKKVIKFFDEVIYIPSERGIFTKIKQDEYELINLHDENSYYLLNYLQKYSVARRELKEFKSEDLKISYKYNDGSNEEFSYSSNDYFPTYLASSGIRNILSMALLIEYARIKKNVSTIILEEPEISLFPDNQFEFIRYLIKIKNTSENINQLILSTHSTDVLGTFSISAYAGYLLKKHPNLNDDILNILNDLEFDDKCLINNNEDFVAYYVKDGTCQKILIAENDFFVIDDEELLKVSNFTGKIINELYELASKNNH